MKTDIEIAQEAKLLPIKEVAKKLDITEDDLELYGKYKAKLTDELWEQVKDREDGKLILVTAINPTPAGEGKTTVTVGLGQALGKMNKKSVIALREPSRTLFWNQGRCSRWWKCTGSTNGRFEFTFHRGFSCNYFC